LDSKIAPTPSLLCTVDIPGKVSYELPPLLTSILDIGPEDVNEVVSYDMVEFVEL